MIDLSKIVQIRLLKENYKKFPFKEHYEMVLVDKGNYQEYFKDLTCISSLIKKELPDWSEAPTLDTVVERFSADSHCLLFYYNKKCIGWNWGNKDVRFDWINKVQSLPEGELYGGGCFVSKKLEHPPDAGVYNYNMIFDYWINKLNYHTIYGYIDYWNKPAFRVNFQNGLTVYNYLNVGTNEG